MGEQTTERWGPNACQRCGYNEPECTCIGGYAPKRETTGSRMETVCTLSNGCTLYREPNGVGGHRYWSDEIGGGVMVWDTCIVSPGTLLTAIVEEERRFRAERDAARAR